MTLDQVDVHIAAWEAASTALAEGRSSDWNPGAP